ncbi:nitrogenase [Picosynechococcus sp. PCC 11901]|uniref:Mo-dependent nitrogenase C-terminal domain-containing protein n=1 Tax=unclassified Picosynechococcus TaxID=3079910 RepID=UPI00081089C7|nr:MULTISPECIES: Mo-dependent nitrogenase C-terminal domain-containing protein [unclassified Picosynechococcus]ANV88848.1 nitrogenase [Picosynechococcus sp. PCC 7117]QCS48628.1 nitrogenase [Picosynechococcus sp. PCC 11901]
MSSASTTVYSDRQITAWLRGLLTIAWADGHFDAEEQELITRLTQDELAPHSSLGDLEPITGQELAADLGEDLNIRENFLRTAVMMAIADGVYSIVEADQIKAFGKALGVDLSALHNLEKTLYDPETVTTETPQPEVHLDALKPIRNWLDGMDIDDPRVARFICKMVPPQCPFERDIKLFGKKIVHIPPMCKLNPLYEQLVGLRFRSLSYLADDCDEDISEFI